MDGLKTPKMDSERRKWEPIPSAGLKEWRGTNESASTTESKESKRQKCKK